MRENKFEKVILRSFLDAGFEFSAPGYIFSPQKVRKCERSRVDPNFNLEMTSRIFAAILATFDLRFCSTRKTDLETAHFENGYFNILPTPDWIDNMANHEINTFGFSISYGILVIPDL